MNKCTIIDGEIEIKTPIVRNKARLIENVIDDGVRFLKRLLPLVAMLLLGYYYGKSNYEPIVVSCITPVQQEYITLPASLPKTGVKWVNNNEILITKDVCDPIKARRKLHKYLIQKKLGKR